MSQPAPSTANASPEPVPSRKQSPWRWVLLALWFLWLLALIFMSRNEWGKPRPQVGGENDRGSDTIYE
jgi:hypothetical protein